MTYLRSELYASKDDKVLRVPVRPLGVRDLVLHKMQATSKARVDRKHTIHHQKGSTVGNIPAVHYG